MDSGDLQPEQAAKVMASVGKQLDYLNRLSARMQHLGFPPNDPLWRAVGQARDAMRDLRMAAHYASCKHGVG